MGFYGFSEPHPTKDSDLVFSDITTNDVSTTKHGFTPKAPNDATKYLDGTGAYSVPTGSGTPNRAYFKYKAALLEPLALEAIQVNSFTYTLTAGTPKILLASFNTKLGSAGRMESRNPHHPLILNTGLSLAGIGSGACAVIIDPALPTYTDAEATYYARLNSLASDSSLAQKTANLSAAQTVDFLPGPYGSLITQLTSFDYDWIVARPYDTTVGWNLWDEIGDSTIQRLGDGLIIPVAKGAVSKLQSTGAGGLGTVVYVILPSTWGKVTDSTSYGFRDDFMGASLDTASAWTRTETATGQMEIDTTWQWLKVVGNSNWGQNGVFSQYSFTKAANKVFLCDVYTAQSWGTTGFGMVGFSDGLGQSYTNMAYALNFGTNGAAARQLNVFENSTARGAVGSAYSLGATYRVRITCQGSGTSGAKYEIQGGPEYATIGGSTWTDVTPGTTSSATTTLHAGLTWFKDTAWISDVRVY